VGTVIYTGGNVGDVVGGGEQSCAGFVRQKRRKKVPSFIKQKAELGNRYRYIYNALATFSDQGQNRNKCF
jgi:hypothetical protein